MRTLGTLHSPHSLFLLKPFPFIMELFWHCLCFSDITEDDTGISDFRIILYFSHRGSLQLVPKGKLVVSQMELYWSQIPEVITRWHITGFCHKPQVTPHRAIAQQINDLVGLSSLPGPHLACPVNTGERVDLHGFLFTILDKGNFSRHLQYPFPQCNQVDETQLLHIKFIQTFTLMLSYPCILISF